MSASRVVQQDINEELFTSFNPDEELWVAAGSSSARGQIGRDGSGTDSDIDSSSPSPVSPPGA